MTQEGYFCRFVILTKLNKLHSGEERVSRRVMLMLLPSLLLYTPLSAQYAGERVVIPPHP